MADSEKKELRRVLKTGVRIRGRRYTAAGLDKYIGCVISLSLPDGDAPESLLGRIGKDKIRLRALVDGKKFNEAVPVVEGAVNNHATA